MLERAFFKVLEKKSDFQYGLYQETLACFYADTHAVTYYCINISIWHVVKCIRMYNGFVDK